MNKLRSRSSTQMDVDAYSLPLGKLKEQFDWIKENKLNYEHYMSLCFKSFS